MASNEGLRIVHWINCFVFAIVCLFNWLKSERTEKEEKASDSKSAQRIEEIESLRDADSMANVRVCLCLYHYA